VNEPFDISDYLFGEMEPAEQRRAETLMAEDEDLRLRVEALASVCSRLDALPAEGWEQPEPPQLPDPVPESKRETKPGPAASVPRRRTLLARPLAAGAFVAGLIGVGFGAGLLVDGGGESGPIAGGGDEPAERIELNPIASIDPPPSGTLLISGDGSARRAELSAAGLPVSERVLYELWLLDSARGQMSLGTFAPGPGGEATVAMPMPVEDEAYTYVDVSREPADGDPAHSGHSILRAPTGP
jgi:anti-sigma-K factor RskA